MDIELKPYVGGQLSCEDYLPPPILALANAAAGDEPQPYKKITVRRGFISLRQHLLRQTQRLETSPSPTKR